MRNIKLENTEVEIRRAKLKEVKSIIRDMATKVTEVANFFYKQKMTDDEFLESIPRFVVDNIEFFEKYLLQFSDLKQEQLDDLEFLSVVKLVKELITYNGVSEDFLNSFFHSFKASKLQVENQDLVRNIPQTMAADLRA